MNLNPPDFNQSLYCLTSDEVDLSHSQQVQSMCRSGVRLIQLRSKVIPFDLLFEEAKKSVEICKTFGATLIVNDFIEVASRSGASGIHLGYQDANAARAADLLGKGGVIGETVHSLEEAKEVRKRGVCSYVGLGPVRESSTKRTLQPRLTGKEIKEIIHLLNPIPVYLIGGLGLSDFNLLESYGVTGICVCSGLSKGKQFGVHLQAFVEQSDKLKLVKA